MSYGLDTIWNLWDSVLTYLSLVKQKLCKKYYADSVIMVYTYVWKSVHSSKPVWITWDTTSMRRGQIRFSPPKNVQELRSFIGLNLASVLHPLHDLRSTNKP